MDDEVAFGWVFVVDEGDAFMKVGVEEFVDWVELIDFKPLKHHGEILVELMQIFDCLFAVLIFFLF